MFSSGQTPTTAQQGDKSGNKRFFFLWSILQGYVEWEIIAEVVMVFRISSNKLIRVIKFLTEILQPLPGREGNVQHGRALFENMPVYDPGSFAIGTLFAQRKACLETTFSLGLSIFCNIANFLAHQDKSIGLPTYTLF